MPNSTVRGLFQILTYEFSLQKIRGWGDCNYQDPQRSREDEDKNKDEHDKKDKDEDEDQDARLAFNAASSASCSALRLAASSRSTSAILPPPLSLMTLINDQLQVC